jgi:hypothetical protein
MHLQRISLSVWIGTSLTFVLVIVAGFFPYPVSKAILWQASILVTDRDSEGLMAGVYYSLALLLGMPIYSVVVYAVLSFIAGVRTQRGNTKVNAG